MIYETEVFKSVIYTCKNEKFLQLDNIFSNYITYAIKRDSHNFKDKSDFGCSYHSEKLTDDMDLSEFQSWDKFLQRKIHFNLKR